MTKESSTKHQVKAAHTIQVQSYGSEIQLVAEVADSKYKGELLELVTSGQLWQPQAPTGHTGIREQRGGRGQAQRKMCLLQQCRANAEQDWSKYHRVAWVAQASTLPPHHKLLTTNIGDIISNYTLSLQNALLKCVN